MESIDRKEKEQVVETLEATEFEMATCHHPVVHDFVDDTEEPEPEAKPE